MCSLEVGRDHDVAIGDDPAAGSDGGGRGLRDDLDVGAGPDAGDTADGEHAGRSHDRRVVGGDDDDVLATRAPGVDLVDAGVGADARRRRVREHVDRRGAGDAGVLARSAGDRDEHDVAELARGDHRRRGRAGGDRPGIEGRALADAGADPAALTRTEAASPMPALPAPMASPPAYRRMGVASPSSSMALAR